MLFPHAKLTVNRAKCVGCDKGDILVNGFFISTNRQWNGARHQVVLRVGGRGGDGAGRTERGHSVL